MSLISQYVQKLPKIEFNLLLMRLELQSKAAAWN